MLKKKDLAILVSNKYYHSPYADDLALKSAMEKMGHTADIVSWDDDSKDYSMYKMAIIRSCWDYDQKLYTFLEKMQTISEHCSLLNPIETVKKNSSKYYLRSLEEKGIPIVPTLYIENENEIKAIKDYFKTEELIVKPVISASGRDTYRFHHTDKESIADCIKNILIHKQVMIQPYVKSIETNGERSTVIIDGEPVFTMKKTPKKGGFLVHQYHGGLYQPTELKHSDIWFLEKTMSVLDEMPLYVRVDYVYDENGDPMLLELEMIEPNLYLSQNPRGLELLTHRLSQMAKSHI